MTLQGRAAQGYTALSLIGSGPRLAVRLTTSHLPYRMCLHAPVLPHSGGLFVLDEEGCG